MSYPRTPEERAAAWQQVAAGIRDRIDDLDYLRKLGESNAFPVAYFVLLEEIARLRGIINSAPGEANAPRGCTYHVISVKGCSRCDRIASETGDVMRETKS